MQTRSSRSPGVGAILGLVGGALLIVGALMTWATVSFNVENIARAFGVDPSVIPAGLIFQSQSYAGTSSNDGKIALVCGVLVLIAAMLSIASIARRAAAVALLITGVLGGGVALYDALAGEENAREEGAKALGALGFPGDAGSFFDVSLGIGIWICVAGGLIAALAGILSIASKPAEGPATVSPAMPPVPPAPGGPETGGGPPP